MQLSFFNTLAFVGDELNKAIIQAEKQEDRVEAIFRWKKKGMTPFDVHEIYCNLYPACPITSIRRTMTTLTGDGILEKTGEMREGDYGKPNFVWKLKS